MLNIFKKRRKIIIDETLGYLTFNKSNRLNESYWSVNRKVASSNEMIEFYIYNDKNQIDKTQKELILEILEKYPELITKLETFLNNKLRKFDSNSFFISLVKDLNINFISIPENHDKLKKWEINFVEKKGFTTYEIEIENWKPIDLGISA